MHSRDCNKLGRWTEKNHSEVVTSEVGGDWILNGLECLAEGLVHHEEEGTVESPGREL